MYKSTSDPSYDGPMTSGSQGMTDKYLQEMQQQQGPIAEKERTFTDRLEVIVNLIDEANTVTSNIRVKLFGRHISEAAPSKGEQKSPEGIQYSLDEAEGSMCRLLKSLYSISERL